MKSRTAMLSGAALMIVSVAFLVAAQALQSFLVLLMGMIVTGVAAALGYRGSLQVINEIAPKEQRAEVIATFKIVCFTGNALPVIGVGVLSTLYSSWIALLSLAAMTSVLAVIALATEMTRRQKHRLQAAAR